MKWVRFRNHLGHGVSCDASVRERYPSAAEAHCAALTILSAASWSDRPACSYGSCQCEICGGVSRGRVLQFEGDGHHVESGCRAQSPYEFCDGAVAGEGFGFQGMTRDNEIRPGEHEARQARARSVTARSLEKVPVQMRRITESAGRDRQQFRYSVRTYARDDIDGCSITYAIAGSGPPLGPHARRPHRSVLRAVSPTNSRAASRSWSGDRAEHWQLRRAVYGRARR